MPGKKVLCFVLAVRILYSLALVLLLDVNAAEEFYDDIARNLVAGRGYVIFPGDEPTLYRPPLYPLLLAGYYSRFADPYAAVVATQLLLDVATIVLVFLLGRDLFGARVGGAAVVLAALYPFSALYVVRYLTESVFAFLLVGALYAWMKAVRTERTAWYAACGLCLGAGTLARFSLFYLVPVMLAGALVPAGERVRRLPRIGLMAVCAAAVIAPWSIRNARLTGETLLLGTGSGYNIWLGNHVVTGGRDKDELRGADLERLTRDIDRITAGRGNRFTIEDDRRFLAAAKGEFRDHPGATLRLIGAKALRFWFSIFSLERRGAAAVLVPVQALLMGLALWGAVMALRRAPGVSWMLIAMPLYFNALHALVVSTFRYSIPVMPAVILLAALPVARYVAPGTCAGWTAWLSGADHDGPPTQRGAAV